jgi:hypothetical protein
MTDILHKTQAEIDAIIAKYSEAEDIDCALQNMSVEIERILTITCDQTTLIERLRQDIRTLNEQINAVQDQRNYFEGAWNRAIDAGTKFKCRAEQAEAELAQAKEQLAAREIKNLQRIWKPSQRLQIDSYSTGQANLYAFLEESKKNIHIDLTDGGQTWQGYVPLPKDWRK